jgi:predicted phosphodiesterase
MRLRVLSDLHLEFGPFEPPLVPADVVVLAGDIHLGARGVRWAATAFPHTPVLYVPGNHEYYRSAIPHLTEKLRDAARGTTVQILAEDEVRIGGVRFLGCTLWTDFELHHAAHLARTDAAALLNDYALIRLSPQYRRLRPEDTERFHRTARRWLAERLTAGPAETTVVVTHHAPSPGSIDPRFEQDSLSAAYASDLTGLMAERGPAVWIHGHTHAAADYRVGGTRVVCNPRGYTDEPVAAFDPRLVVEVPYG